MNTKIQYFLAVAVAALWSDIFLASTWRKARFAFTVWFYREKDLAPADMIAGRMSVCQQCPIFYRPLQTCGTPLKKEDKSLGCWCYMAIKATSRHATCWLDDDVENDPERRNLLDLMKAGWKYHGY